MKQAVLKKIPGVNFRFAVITARFNPKITAGLLNGCLKALKESGVKQSRITQHEVPGSFELPWAAKAAALTRKYDAVICLGAIIKGGTDHYHFIAAETTRGISEVGRQTNVPVIFGVLTCDTLAQAVIRSTGKHNKGYEAGWAGVEMAALKRQIK